MPETPWDATHRLERDFPVAFSIYAMSRAQRAVAAVGLAAMGLFPGQEIMLMELDTDVGRPQKDLADSLRISHVTVTKMISRMERAGVVERRRSENDRRISLVHLTAAGLALQQDILVVWAELESAAARGLTGEDRRAYLAAAAAIRGALDTTAAARGIGPTVHENQEERS